MNRLGNKWADWSKINSLKYLSRRHYNEITPEYFRLLNQINKSNPNQLIEHLDTLVKVRCSNPTLLRSAAFRLYTTIDHYYPPQVIQALSHFTELGYFDEHTMGSLLGRLDDLLLRDSGKRLSDILRIASSSHCNNDHLLDAITTIVKRQCQHYYRELPVMLRSFATLRVKDEALYDLLFSQAFVNRDYLKSNVIRCMDYYVDGILGGYAQKGDNVGEEMRENSRDEALKSVIIGEEKMKKEGMFHYGLLELLEQYCQKEWLDRLGEGDLIRLIAVSIKSGNREMEKVFRKRLLFVLSNTAYLKGEGENQKSMKGERKAEEEGEKDTERHIYGIVSAVNHRLVDCGIRDGEVLQWCVNETIAAPVAKECHRYRETLLSTTYTVAYFSSIPCSNGIMKNEWMERLLEKLDPEWEWSYENWVKILRIGLLLDLQGKSSWKSSLTKIALEKCLCNWKSLSLPQQRWLAMCLSTIGEMDEVEALQWSNEPSKKKQECDEKSEEGQKIKMMNSEERTAAQVETTKEEIHVQERMSLDGKLSNAWKEFKTKRYLNEVVLDNAVNETFHYQHLPPPVPLLPHGMHVGAVGGVSGIGFFQDTTRRRKHYSVSLGGREMIYCTDGGNTGEVRAVVSPYKMIECQILRKAGLSSSIYGFNQAM